MYDTMFKTVLTKSGKTIPEIAQDIGVTKQALYYMIKNPQNLSVVQLRTLSKATDVRIERLVRIALKY